jgi:hypothetical protein
MTTTTTTGKADDKPETADSTKGRSHGVERVREEECYHLTALIKNCLDEAGSLISDVQQQAQERYLDFRGEKTEPLDFTQISQRLRQVADCAIIALFHLEVLAEEVNNQWTDQLQVAWVARLRMHEHDVDSDDFR